MRRSEEAIDKVLAGLREAEAPAGMEQRILEALERRPLAQPAARWWAMTPVWGLAAACLVCGVVLGAVAVTWMTPRIHEVHESSAVPALPKSLSASAVGTPRVDTETTAEDMHRAFAKPSVPLEKVTRARKALPVKEEDSEALAEMRAASRPAPPMPLTEQEKMLVRLSKKDGASEAKELDPAARAKKEADELAEFQNFFEPPKTGDTE